jgi:beta-lactamase class A
MARNGRAGSGGRLAWLLAIVLLAIVVLAGACGSSSTKAGQISTTAVRGTAVSAGAASSTAASSSSITLPSTPAGTQAKWLLGATAHLPIPIAEIRAHFDSAFLGQVTPAQLNQVLQGARGLALVSILADQPRALVAVVAVGGEAGSRLQISLAVDAEGLISGLLIGPPPPPTTWAELDASVRSVAPKVKLLVAKMSGDSFQSIHSIDPTAPAPLASAFKLYVLAALGEAISTGKVSWDQSLTITASLKSIPTGVLQNQPDGSQVSVQDAATKMIAISDNTAADLLINLLGRQAVEAELRATGMADPSLDEPFLTTRENAILKIDDWPSLADKFSSADQTGRRELLAGPVEQAPLPSLDQLQQWTQPRRVDSIEWFASAEDVCRAYVALQALAAQPGLAPIGDILSTNDGGLRLDASEWKTTWFKGGYEPGVLTLTYLARRQNGDTYVVTILAEDPSRSLDQTLDALVLLSAVKGGFQLAAGS